MTAQLQVKYRVVNVDGAVFHESNPHFAELVQGRKVFVVADERVMELYGQEMTAYLSRHTQFVDLMAMPGDESEKHWGNVERVCARALKCNLERSAVIVAVGGGIVMDVVGVAASLYRRGIDYLRVPTTLIGLVDVAVGIKHGFNFGEKKNALGTFYPPLGAIADRRFLRTLEERHLRCGLAEILKMGIVCEPRLFGLIEEYGAPLIATRFALPGSIADDIILLSQAAMIRELEPNLFEHDKKRLADFGHTVSPALEAATQYRVHHGESVAIDMMLSCAIALGRGLCSAKDFARIRRVYRDIGLPAICDAITVELVEQSLREARKHRGGALNLVVPTAIGTGVFLQDVERTDVVDALAILKNA